jgi:hypothetical protein
MSTKSTRKNTLELSAKPLIMCSLVYFGRILLYLLVSRTPTTFIVAFLARCPNILAAWACLQLHSSCPRWFRGITDEPHNIVTARLPLAEI